MVRAGNAGVRPPFRFVYVLAFAGVLLAGCEGGGVLSSPREASRAGSGLDLTAPVRSGAVERDVPAPEVFSRTDRGLWDGRPSLGGIWVAHPSAQDPERVLIRNTTTGAEVIGALFRRERENPGPRFQISSEAASELGILAGQPAEIEVIALRLERVEPETARPIDETEAAETTATEAEAPSSTAAAPAQSRAQAPDDTRADTRADAPAAEAPPADAAVTEVAIVEEPPARRGLRDLFRRRSADEAPEIRETALDAPADSMPDAPSTEDVAVSPAAAPAEPVAQPASRPAPRSTERSWRPRRGGEPLAGTAFLGAGPQDAGATSHAAAAGAGSQARDERPRLRDLFRRRAEPAPVDDTLIPLPDETG